MAHKIIWSPAAIEDLEEIRDYVARDSEAYAAALVERVLLAVDQLVDFPHLGQQALEFNDDSIRHLVVEPYRVIYRVDRHAISIAAVVHGARRFPDAFAGREI